MPIILHGYHRLCCHDTAKILLYIFHITIGDLFIALQKKKNVSTVAEWHSFARTSQATRLFVMQLLSANGKTNFLNLKKNTLTA
jgi:hypothetical protein